MILFKENGQYKTSFLTKHHDKEEETTM